MITVADLQDQTGKPGPHPALHCYECGSDYSANRGDYDFNRPLSYPFFCCDHPMVLVVKHTVYEEV